MPERFEFKVAPFVTSSFELDGDLLVHRQGVRRTEIALAHVSAFALHERAPFLGLAQAQLLFRTTSGRILRRNVDPRQPAFRALIEAIAARAPSADLTALPWPDAAARIGVTAYPWYDGFLEPRSVIGELVLGGALAASATEADARDRVERIAQGSVFAIAALIGIVLVASGFRSARKRRKRAATSRAA